MNNTQLRHYFALLRCGDTEAFAAIYSDMKTPVYTIIYRSVGSHEAAEDIMQELFLRLFRSPPGDEIQNPRAYIFRAAHNMSVDYLRKQPPAPLEDIPPCTDADNHAINRHLDIEMALGRLSEEQRQVVSLRVNADLTLRQTALIMGKSMAHVHRTYHQALRTLRQLLG